MVKREKIIEEDVIVKGIIFKINKKLTFTINEYGEVVDKCFSYEMDVYNCKYYSIDALLCVNGVMIDKKVANNSSFKQYTKAKKLFAILKDIFLSTWMRK